MMLALRSAIVAATGGDDDGIIHTGENDVDEYFSCDGDDELRDIETSMFLNSNATDHDVVMAAMDAEMDQLLARFGMQPESNVDPNNEDEQLARNLIANRDEPIFEGSKLTVFMAAFLFLMEKREGKIRDGAFDRLCRIIHEVLLPKGNLFPRSLYLMKKVVGCEDIDDYALHVCVNDCTTFPQIPKKDWKNHSHEQCECGESRFEKKIECGYLGK
jgi:hypothetical protein